MSLAINNTDLASKAMTDLNVSQERLPATAPRLSSGAQAAAGPAAAAKTGAATEKAKNAGSAAAGTGESPAGQRSTFSAANQALNRMSELGRLAQDPTRTQEEVDAYQKEFTSLQGRLSTPAESGNSGTGPSAQEPKAAGGQGTVPGGNGLAGQEPAGESDRLDRSASVQNSGSSLLATAQVGAQSALRLMG